MKIIFDTHQYYFSMVCLNFGTLIVSSDESDQMTLITIKNSSLIIILTTSKKKYDHEFASMDMDLYVSYSSNQ